MITAPVEFLELTAGGNAPGDKPVNEHPPGPFDINGNRSDAAVLFLFESQGQDRAVQMAGENGTGILF